MAKIKGLDKVLKKLSKFGDEADKSILLLTRSNAQEIAADAKRNAPVNFGKLRQSIVSEQVNEKDSLSYVVGVNAEYGAYVEFGTGAKVQVPSEFSDMAARFKGGRGGSFEQGLQAIKDWCKAKGINQSAAYPIFMSILNTGINAQPYLYPAWVKGKAKYLKDLKDELKRLTTKYN